MLETIPLATAKFKVGNMIDVGDTPRGRRIIGEVTQARLDGERFSASQVGVAAADWALIRADGVVEIDVRISLKTDDGATIFMYYDGYNDPERGARSVLSMMRFETADENYAWLNRVQAVGKGEFIGEVVFYEIYELR